MSEEFGAADRLTRTTLVRDALSAAGDEALVVREDVSLREVALTAEGRAAIRVLAVTDSAGKLSGIIRIPALCDDLFVSVAPEDFISEVLRPGRLEQYARFARSRTAGDLMEPAVAVGLDDSLGTAFRMLHEHNLEGVPVIDVDGRPVSYLDRLRLIAVWLKSHR